MTTNKTTSLTPESVYSLSSTFQKVRMFAIPSNNIFLTWFDCCFYHNQNYTKNLKRQLALPHPSLHSNKTLTIYFSIFLHISGIRYKLFALVFLVLGIAYWLSLLKTGISLSLCLNSPTCKHTTYGCASQSSLCNQNFGLIITQFHIMII